MLNTASGSIGPLSDVSNDSKEEVGLYCRSQLFARRIFLTKSDHDPVPRHREAVNSLGPLAKAIDSVDNFGQGREGFSFCLLRQGEEMSCATPATSVNEQSLTGRHIPSTPRLSLCTSLA